MGCRRVPAFHPRSEAPRQAQALDSQTSLPPPRDYLIAVPSESREGSGHSITSTVRSPRELNTRTAVPFMSGCSDQARYASVPPRIATSTSPGPPDPRVATVSLPGQPTAESFRATGMFRSEEHTSEIQSRQYL